jgi:hypothetical protein
MTNRTGAAELHRACRPHVVEHPACTAGTIEARKGEHLAGYKLAGLLGIHLPGQCRRYHRPGRNDPQHETRKHAVTPTFTERGQPDVSLPAAYHTNHGNIGAAWLVKSEQD